MLNIIIRYLLRLPSNFIIDGIIWRLLDYVKESVVKTRFGYYIRFRTTKPIPTNIRKNVILGRYEKDYLSMLTSLVEPGDHVIDAGAHEGYVSLLMSGVVGNDGRVFSIEPNQENLAYLRDNIKVNSIENIEIIDKAISDSISESAFHYDDDGGAWGSLLDFPYLQARKSATVDVDTLDNLFCKPEYINRLKLCKLDIEGSEMKAIMGGQRVISECKPHVAFEVNLTYWAYHDVSIEVLFDFLKSNGYDLFVVKNNRLWPYEWLYLRTMNIIAIHKLRKQDLLGKGIFAESS